MQSMSRITQEELNERIERHGKWVRDEIGGVRLDLSWADLSGANLCEANLREANLTEVNLRGANLNGADLRGANLNGADLRGANLNGADLTGANLSWAYLTGVDLTDANLDMSAWPLWCGSAHSNIKVDKKIAAQLLYHACIIAQQHIKIPKTLIKFVEKYFHRYSKVEKLEGGK